MSDVKMPPPMGSFDYREGTTLVTEFAYTEAQLKQYGDDRAREALELAATVCDKANGPEYPADLAIKIRGLK